MSIIKSVLSKNKKRNIFYVLVFIITSLLTCQNVLYPGVKSIKNTNSRVVEALVIRIVDGDTVEVKMLGKYKGLASKEKVRFIGVDTPETKHPKKNVQYFGKEATSYTKRQLLNKKVILSFDTTTRDRYGRLLCYVFRKNDKFFINLMLIHDGYGYAYTKYPFRYEVLFLRAQKEAKNKKLGLWK